jgi:hypothetical protein
LSHMHGKELKNDKKTVAEGDCFDDYRAAAGRV